MVSFSLFEGDLVNRVYSKLGLGARHPLHVFGRIVILWLLTWMPLAILALVRGIKADAPASENFFCDLAAYVQIFLGLPLFVIAETVIGRSTREGADRFANHSLMSEEDGEKINAFNAKIEFLRKSIIPEILLILFAYGIAIITMLPKFADDVQTWHVMRVNGQDAFTNAGIWETFVTLPILNYWWLRWVWKISLWTSYLFKVSSFRLLLVPSHPDRTAGLGFLSEVQTKFGLVILAYGVSNVLATVAHEIAIEKMSVEVMTVWGPIVSFIIGAPVLFTVPLLLFTKQLHRVKKRAIQLYEDKALERARRFEAKWLHAVETGDMESMSGAELAGMNNLTEVFERIHKMRVIPFDMRSLAELVGSAIGPILPLLPYLDVIPEPILKMIQEMTKWLKH